MPSLEPATGRVFPILLQETRSSPGKSGLLLLSLNYPREQLKLGLLRAQLMWDQRVYGKFVLANFLMQGQGGGVCPFVSWLLHIFTLLIL